MGKFYQEVISGALAKLRPPLNGVDPRHVEAYMLLRFSTLDHLSRMDYDREVPECAAASLTDPEGSERLARSYGL
jgi:hypothetical protein